MLNDIETPDSEKRKNELTIWNDLHGDIYQPSRISEDALDRQDFDVLFLCSEEQLWQKSSSLKSTPSYNIQCTLLFHYLLTEHSNQNQNQRP